MDTAESDLLLRADAASNRALAHLRERQRADGAWTDRLSSSTVATSLGALSLVRADRSLHRDRVAASLEWLRAHQRDDGGWAMADAHPPSSPGMTAFAVATLEDIDPLGSRDHIERAWRFLDLNDGDAVIPGMSGKAPKTWPAAAPIIWALTGLRARDQQPDQPVEAILLPPSVRNKVSIALPVILALGVMQARTVPRSPVRRVLSKVAEPRALNWLREVSGTNGGIEECPMIAGFVYLALREAGVGEDLQLSSVDYLLQTQREDGSWAIDRDLEISVTAYSVMALAEFVDPARESTLDATREWLVAQQWNRPFSPLGLPAGGWGWALPSGWPESEDTAVVLGVLPELGVRPRHPAVRLGVRWLEQRQNRDGSWSEWVRNSRIMNDRPCPGVTAHAVIALIKLGEPTGPGTAAGRGLAYLQRTQAPDGSVSSVWFRDSVHGTCRLLEAMVAAGRGSEPPAQAARRWLLEMQAFDGGWPARHDLPPNHATAEETGWALFALLEAGEPADSTAVTRAVSWLLDRQTATGTWDPSTVGLYFDDLCYTDDLIAHTFSLRAVGRWLECAKR